MIVENIFENKIYPELKKYVEEKSIYSPTVTKAMPQQSKVFPIVPVKILPVTNKYNNLSYGEETYTFGIEINVYSQDKTIDSKKISKRTICNEVTEQVVEISEEAKSILNTQEALKPRMSSNIYNNSNYHEIYNIYYY